MISEKMVSAVVSVSTPGVPGRTVRGSTASIGALFR